MCNSVSRCFLFRRYTCVPEEPDHTLDHKEKKQHGTTGSAGSAAEHQESEGCARKAVLALQEGGHHVPGGKSGTADALHHAAAHLRHRASPCRRSITGRAGLAHRCHLRTGQGRTQGHHAPERARLHARTISRAQSRIDRRTALRAACRLCAEQDDAGTYYQEELFSED